MDLTKRVYVSDTYYEVRTEKKEKRKALFPSFFLALQSFLRHTKDDMFFRALKKKWGDNTTRAAHHITMDVSGVDEISFDIEDKNQPIMKILTLDVGT